MRRQDDPASVASKTYRKVNKQLAHAIGARVSHTRYPSEDFEDLLDKLDDKTKARAIRWYERGIKRGISFATDRVLDGTIRFSQGVLTSPKVLNVRVRMKFRDEPWSKRTFKIKAENAGFAS